MLDIHVQSRPTAAAITSLVTLCGWVAADLHDLSPRPAFHTVAGCRSRENWEPRLQPRYN